MLWRHVPVQALIYALAWFSVAWATIRNQLPRWLRGAPRPGDTVLHVPWMDAQLKRSGVVEGDETVIEADILDIGDNRGLASDTHQVKVVVRTSDGSTRELWYIIKANLNAFNTRLRTITSGGNREADLYLRTDDFGVTELAPGCVYSYSCWWLCEYVLLLENVTKRDSLNVVAANLTHGNQCWGVPEGFLSGPSSLTVLTKTYETAADLHAKHWRKPELIDGTNDWMKGSKWYRGQGRHEWELALERCRANWAAVDWSEKTFVSERMRTVITNTLDRASWDVLVAHLQDPKTPWTLCHGDFHASNMFYLEPKDGGDSSMSWFDWSEVGPWEPTTDLGQTIISDVSPDVFVPHARELIHKYWTRLESHGVTDNYSEEECWDAFRRGTMERWIYLSALLISWPLPQAFFEYILGKMEVFEREFFDELPDHYVMKPLCIVW